MYIRQGQSGHLKLGEPRLTRDFHLRPYIPKTDLRTRRKYPLPPEADTQHKMPVVTRSKSAAAKPVLDFSKMPKKPISEGFVFPKSTEQKLAEALAEIEALNNENAKLKKDVKNVKEMNSILEDAIEQHNASHKEYKMNLLAKMNEHAKDSGVIWGAMVAWRQMLKNEGDIDENTKNELLLMINGKAMMAAEMHGSLTGFVYNLKNTLLLPK